MKTNDGQREHSLMKQEILDQFDSRMKVALEDVDQKNVDVSGFDRFLDQVEQSYLKEINVLDNRAALTENLAAIGLSAETAYHDANLLLLQANRKLGLILQKYKKNNGALLDILTVLDDLTPIKNQIETASRLMSNVQRLFPSSRAKKGSVNVYQVVNKVKDLYILSLEKAQIDCSIIKNSSEGFIVESTDAVLFQVFINLFDNALYWLKTVGKDRIIQIYIEQESKRIWFSDTGPGVKEEDAPYIFDAFYSGKGEDGKGLGLYIARQLLERYNATIDLVLKEEEKKLSGANFIIQFSETEEKDGIKVS